VSETVSPDHRAPVQGLTTGCRRRQTASAYGHTPGHTAYVVESRDEKLVLWGDVVHVAAVQFDDPSVTIEYDVNSAEAEHERELAFADAAKNGYLFGGAHMSFPGIGHVRSNGKQAYTFVPLNYSSLK
jgi:glyoxylase-like metal-dependent hydrolase (beta-lactamase superfamily II)